MSFKGVTWQRVRDVILLLGGLAIAIQQAVKAPDVSEALITLAAIMMGYPIAELRFPNGDEDEK